MSDTRQYELMYVIAPTVGDDGVADLHTQVEEIVSRSGGEIEKSDNWGKRRLAYEIKSHREGTYVLELINGPGELVRELNRRLKVTDEVLRHLVVRVDEDLKKSARVRNTRQVKQQRRREARGLASEVVPATGASQASSVAKETPAPEVQS